MAKQRFSIKTLLLIVGICAAVIYGLCAASIGRPAIVRDAFAYNMTAQRLVASGIYEYTNSTNIHDASPNAFHLPGYLLFLAPFYFVSGTSGNAIQNTAHAQGMIILAQLLLAVAVAIILTYAAYRWKGLRSGAIAGALAIAYIPFGLNASITLTETLNLFFVSLLMLTSLAICDEKNPLKARAFVLFAIFGAAALYVRPVVALWLIIALVICLLVHKDRLKECFKYLALALSVLALCMAPWVIRNAASLHQFVVLSTDPNPIFDSVGGMASLTAEEKQLWNTVAAKGEIPQTVIARKRISEALKTNAVGFIGNRALQSVNAFTYPTFLAGDLLAELQSTDYSKAPNSSLIVKSTSFMPESKSSLYNFMWYWSRTLHWILIALAIVAIVLGYRNKHIWLLVSFIIYYLLVHALILVQVRYYYPTVLVLVLLSAFAISEVWERLVPAKAAVHHPKPKKKSKK